MNERSARRSLATFLVALQLASAVHGAAAPLAGAAPARTLRSDLVAQRTSSELGLVAAAMPQVTMRSGVLVTDDGRVLWSRNAEDRRAIASITKLMTAIVALEHAKPDELITVPEDSVSVGESTSFLRPGEALPLSELLEALLVKSGNDAAVAIAEYVSGDQEAFVRLMNEKAAALQLEGTRFANPHGLDEPGHYSTAADLGVLARYAMSREEIRSAVGQKTVRIGTGPRAEQVENTNLLIGNFKGANGTKTGWTDEAGYCVIASARRGGIELYAIVLGTDGELARFKDASDLLDWGFAHYREQRLVSAGTVVAEARVSDYLDRTVPARVASDTATAIFDLAGPIDRSVAVADVKAPLKVGDRVGVATFSQNGEVVVTVPLVAAEEVRRPNVLARAWIAAVRGWRRLAALFA